MLLRGVMFTRYATFIFLIGLSALFFTSGRSATRNEEAWKNPPPIAAMAERGGVPDADGKLPMPRQIQGTTTTL